MNRKSQQKLLFLIIILLLFLATTVVGQRPKPKETMVKGHTMFTLLKPGDIPAIFEPEFVPVSEADLLYYPEEPLIAVIDGNVAKGYSTWHLDHHEIVNDYINNKAITVTW